MVPFEGSEKKCELLVRETVDLRALPPAFWHSVVRACEATVLSTLHGEGCDAYLLSESSLFVWKHRLLLITCGQTRLVASVHAVLDHLGTAPVQALLFQRKNEYFSHLQHTNFDEDVASLQARLPGRRVCLGSQDSHHTQVFVAEAGHVADPTDRTTELLMYGLGAAATERLTCAGLTPSDLRAFLQVDRMLPGCRVDDFVFDPFGYSLNALRGDDYLTIHITPEPEGSYMSLETNADPTGLLDLPLEILRPASFDLVLYNPANLARLFGSLPSRFAVQQRQSERLDSGYRLEFAHYAGQETP